VKAAGSRFELRVDFVDTDLVARLSAIGEVEVVGQTVMRVVVENPDDAARLAKTVVHAGRSLLAMLPEGSTLEDMFVGMVDGGDR
jgi:hypothetical protein